MTETSDTLRAQVLRVIAEWQIPVIQFNGMIAEHLGLNWSELMALYALATHGPASPGQLARRVNLTSGAGSRMIDRLVRAGFVRRVPDETDRRKVLIEPDPDGLERVATMYAGILARHRKDLEPLQDNDLAALVRFMVAATRSTEEEIARLAGS